jgi:hypothetical protein
MEPFQSIAYYSIMGKPLVMYGGIVTLLVILAAGAVGYSTIKGKRKFSMQTHMGLAFLGILLALGHGLLAFLAYL